MKNKEQNYTCLPEVYKPLIYYKYVKDIINGVINEDVSFKSYIMIDRDETEAKTAIVSDMNKTKLIYPTITDETAALFRFVLEQYMKTFEEFYK